MAPRPRLRPAWVGVALLLLALAATPAVAWAPPWRDSVLATLTGRPDAGHAGVEARTDPPAGRDDLGTGAARLAAGALVPSPRAAVLLGLGVTGIWIAGRPRAS